MSFQKTPNSNRLHIALFGRRNSGKSSLINALTGQNTALVSDTPGTTTDPVLKAMEIHGIGPCLFIDTPGYDDEGELGKMRITRTLQAIEKTDIALLLCHPDMKEELHWIKILKEKNIPVILLLNKADILHDTEQEAQNIKDKSGQYPLIVSSKDTSRHSRNFASHHTASAGRFRCTKYHGESGFGRGSRSTRHAARHTSTQRAPHPSASTDTPRIA